MLEEGIAGDLFSPGLAHVILAQFRGTIDVLWVSASCCPFITVQRSRRRKGTQEQDDILLLDVDFRTMAEIEPACSLFEQAHGFCMAESSDDPVTPLARFLARHREELPAYTSMTFLADGKTMLVLIRQRVFVASIHSRAGGAQSLQIMKEFVKASALNFVFLCTVVWPLQVQKLVW